MEKIFNVKMRAAKRGDHKQGGIHISGAERIVKKENLEKTVSELMKRAFNHSKGECDFINFSLQELNKEKIIKIPSLDIITIKVDDYKEGRKCAINVMNKSGIEKTKCEHILKLLEDSEDMKGAVIVDINSLKRLDNEADKGVRVTGMDWEGNNVHILEETLEKHNINNNHVKEAVALASKVISAPGIICELCWSDDPDYTAGYVASEELGYVRITHLKQHGDSKGGRIFCFDSSKAEINECINYLRKTVTLINTVPLINGEYTSDKYLEDSDERNK